MSRVAFLTVVFIVIVFYSSQHPFAAPSADEKPKGDVTFCKDIAPILQKHCQECHRTGGIAPMSLQTYAEVRPWAVGIREAVAERKMPPFHAAGPIGRFVEDPRLTEEEIATIVEWVAGGAPQGNDANLPPPRRWKSGWKGGSPDLVLAMPEVFKLHPNRSDDYAFFVLAYHFPEDTWIRGVEVMPGNKEAVHHANVYVIPPDVNGLPAGRVNQVFDPVTLGAKFMVAWEPGCSPLIQRQGIGTLIPKGSRFGIQMHYSPSDKELADQTSLGFFFADGHIDREARTLYGGTRTLEIPAGASKYQVRVERLLPDDALLNGFACHMHLRGKRFLIRLKRPGGQAEDIFEVPSYNPYWQGTYVLTDPVTVPKGTVVEYVATWDNSPLNPLNPDPKQIVRWGDRVDDEMMDGYVYYVLKNERLGINVRKGKVEGTSNLGRRQE